MTDSEKLKKTLEAIDRFNAQDPRKEHVDGSERPHEVVYSERLTRWVLRLNPKASEELRVAARGQHIGRWTIPRTDYPIGRGGYLRWREALKEFHAEKVGEILKEAGYDADFLWRVSRIIRKTDIKGDPDTQTIEDALCLVFLETQFDILRKKTPDHKMVETVRKTWRKMSPRGQAEALKLKLSKEERRFIEHALAKPR